MLTNSLRTTNMVGTTSNCVSIERVSKVTFEPDGSRHTKILEAG